MQDGNALSDGLASASEGTAPDVPIHLFASRLIGFINQADEALRYQLCGRTRSAGVTQKETEQAMQKLANALSEQTVLLQWTENPQTG